MKNLKYILGIALIFISINLYAQTDKATTIRIVEAKNFVFNATTAMPMANHDLNKVLNKMQNGGGGGSIYLSGSMYDLRVTPDSVVAYLPYYGRAYTSTMDPNDSGIKFTSKDFTYKSKKGRKGGWVITIDPKDVKDGQKLTLNISENGYASLSVSNNNRQPISFNGTISEPKTNKE